MPQERSTAQQLPGATEQPQISGLHSQTNIKPTTFKFELGKAEELLKKVTSSQTNSCLRTYRLVSNGLWSLEGDTLGDFIRQSATD